VKGRARVEAAGECNADFLAGWKRLKNGRHSCQPNSVGDRGVRPASDRLGDSANFAARRETSRPKPFI
jgi:hypothetical protein